VTHRDSGAEAIKAVVRRNTEQVQGQGDFALLDELFAEDFVDHTPQPGTTPDKAGPQRWMSTKSSCARPPARIRRARPTERGGVQLP
jgi:hypothetical protein